MTQKKSRIKVNSFNHLKSPELNETNLSELSKKQALSISPPDLSASKKEYQKNKVDTPDIVCLSHLRWNFVYQRPQHLLSRFAQGRHVYFIEEPIFSKDCLGRLDISQDDSGVVVVVPHLPDHLSEESINADLRMLIDRLFAEQNISNYICWYYTPMAIAFTNHLQPQAIVYDCMDELSAFQGAPPKLKNYEAELFRRADLVFTGGQSLYESKVNQHPNVYAFPSSVDVAHFGQARKIAEPAEQANIPHPRLGFFGVIDERMDIELLRGRCIMRI
ncbi:hypothetical protein ACX27_08605 [Nostoc piscinale CENA21]|uniref:Glycosyl transferase n=1 Tax=Nostoc piscinale CENA21 TaxID=224013 RepID=A0A0M4TU04_9NOSO|nr:hypothetical protein [Nostoc piscinale]ALF52906.1 hypothetical protein ACX27_08605 [Nostoc piscinale CENA21]